MRSQLDAEGEHRERGPSMSFEGHAGTSDVPTPLWGTDGHARNITTYDDILPPVDHRRLSGSRRIRTYVNAVARRGKMSLEMSLRSWDIGAMARSGSEAAERCTDEVARKEQIGTFSTPFSRDAGDRIAKSAQ